MTLQQLLLDIRPEEAPSLDNYVVGDNAELMARLAGLADPRVFDQIFLWGPPGSGRSHLLRGALAKAQVRARPVIMIDGAMLGEELAPAPGSLLIVDNVEALSESAQITLFRTFNAARLVGLALLLAGQSPPLRLKLREDLRTRIGATLVYEVKPLSESDMADVLKRHANARGMRIDNTLIEYLLRHGRRDLPSLLRVLDTLDRVSLEQQRVLTLPLLRDVLLTTLDLDDGPSTI